MTPRLKAQYREYLRNAAESAQNLAFLLENLGHPLECDYSVESLEKAEAVFWQCVVSGIPRDLSDLDHFSSLIGQYLGQCIVHAMGAKWVQSRDANRAFGQPCVDRFGGKSWDRVYPVELARVIRDLPRNKPDFPGVSDRRVFAAALERALAVYVSNAKA